MNIMIAIPTKDKIEVETFVAAANLDWDGHNIEYADANGEGVYGIAQARNCIAHKAIDGGFDKLLMIDSDTVVPEDAIKNLLDPDEPIVLGVYRYKNDTGDAPFYGFVQREDGKDCWRWDEIPDGRFEIRSGGFGCAMLDVSVFQYMRLPWFHWDERPNGTHCGEDIWFCDHARNAGLKVWADGRVRCRHIGRKIYE